MILDSEALTALNKHKKTLLEKIQKLEDLKSTQNGKLGSQKKIGINPTLDLIKRYLKDNISQNNETNKFGTIESREFFLPIILSAPHYQAIDKNIENNLRTVIVKSLEMKLKQNGFLDCKIVFKHISLGLNPPIYFYKQDVKDELYSIFDISGISQVLFTESCFFPNIYIYLLLDAANKVKELNWKEILIFVGSVIGNELSNEIEQMVDKFYDLALRSEENV